MLSRLLPSLFTITALLLAPLAGVSAAKPAPGTQPAPHLEFDCDFRDDITGWQTQGQAQFTHDPI